MNESQLENNFLAFLLKKGYPKETLMSQIPLVSSQGIRYQPDLLILDSQKEDYIALIEFKSRFDPTIEVQVAEQVTNYLELIGSKITPAFLVVPSEEEFKIYKLSTDERWLELPKNDFPSYVTLSTKKQIEEKMLQKEIERKKLQMEITKRKKASMASSWILISVISGIIISILSFYLSQKGFFESKPIGQILCCDTISKNIVELENKLALLSQSYKSVSKTDTLLVIDSSKSVKGIDQRLKVIEQGVLNNPERTLSLINIKNDIVNLSKSIENMKELEKERNNYIDTRIDYLNAWIIGIVLAILGASIGIFFTYFKK